MPPLERMTALMDKILIERDVGLRAPIFEPLGNDIPAAERLLDVHLPTNAFAQASAGT